MQVGQEEDEGRVPSTFLYGVGAFMLVVGFLLASVFVFRLQPPLATSQQQTSAQAGVASVIMQSGLGSNTALNYSPTSVTVVIGVNNTVTWVNRDQSIHTVTATDKSFDSGNILAGGSFTYKFTSPGTYTYVCIYHGWMKGTVVVKQPS